MSASAPDPAPAAPQGARVWLRVFLPFVAGYFLSYLLRTVNAVISPELTAELDLGAADLGLLTSTFFLAFALVQLPNGVFLDRFGPRRVEAVLLLFAAVGALLFAVGKDLGTFVVGRALIGLGVSACLMAAFKGLFPWFPAAKQASLTGAIMAVGGLGGLISTRPLEMALPLLGWRGVFLVVALLAVLVAIALLLIAPDKGPRPPPEPFRQQMAALGQIYRSRVFWRFGWQAALIAGGNMAIQALWAVPWLMDVNHYSRPQAAQHLQLMSLAMVGGFIFVAAFSTRLAKRGVPPVVLLGAGSVLSLASGAGMLLDLAPSELLWIMFGLGISPVNLAFSVLGSHFPAQVSGRASTALNLMIFAGGFIIQWGFGGVVDYLAGLGWGRTESFRGAFTLLLALQAASFLWFLLAREPREASLGAKAAG